MLDEEQLRSNQKLMQGIQQRVGSTSPVQDAEESVRTLVSRLEYGAINQKPVPRIIESKCIEKIGDQVKTASQQEQSPLTLSNTTHNTSIVDLANEPSLKPVADIIAQVTVNNHISFVAAPMNTNPTPVVGKIMKPALTRTASQPQNSTTQTKSITKVGRNRNVDLAYTSATTKSTTSTIPQKHNSISQQINAEKNAKNLLNHISETHAMDPPPSMVSTKKPSSTIAVTAQPPLNTTVHHATNPKGQQPKLDTSAAPPAPTTTALETTEDGNALLAPRLVKWNTLSWFDEKNYVTNDVKLKAKPKYDEIEFEEFEVYDPNNPASNNSGNECYDSLNSSK